MTRLLTSLIVVVAAYQTLWAQDARTITAQFSADNQSPLVGEPIELVLSATLDADTTLVEWPEFPEQWSVFEVNDVQALDIVEHDNQTDYQQRMTVTLWEPGSYETPETIITYQQPDGTIEEMIVVSQRFSVPSVLTDDLTLHPFKPQIWLPYLPPALIIAMLGVICTAFIWIFQRRAGRTNEASAGKTTQFERQILAQLKKISRTSQEPEIVYAFVAACLRDYIANQFQLTTQEMTTSELLDRVQPHLSKATFSRLGHLLGQADLVKFARQLPDQQSARRYAEAATQWIQLATKEVNTPAQRSSGGVA